MAMLVGPDDVVRRPGNADVLGWVCCLTERGVDARSDPLYTAHVFWLDDEVPDRDEYAETLEVADRSIVPSDIVGKLGADAQGGVMGTVAATHVTLSVRHADDGAVEHGVSGDDMQQLLPFARGMWVCKGGWLGRVEACATSVTLDFESADGPARCVVLSAGPDDLESTRGKADQWGQLYPGMELRARSADVLSRAQWVRGTYQPELDTGVVDSVACGSVTVVWVAMATTAAEGVLDYTPPSEQCNPAELQPLENLALAWWRLGWRGIHGGRLAQVVAVRTGADVVWQDGTRQADIPACDLSLAHPSPHDLFSGDFVRSKEDDVAKKPSSYGFVEKTNSSERMCEVLWKDGDKYLEASSCSVYDIALDTDLAFRIGDTVMRLSALAEGVAPLPSPAEAVDDDDDEETEVPAMSTADTSEATATAADATPAARPLPAVVAASPVGAVRSITDGKVQVKWMNGSESAEFPDSLYLIASEDGDELAAEPVEAAAPADATHEVDGAAGAVDLVHEALEAGAQGLLDYLPSSSWLTNIRRLVMRAVGAEEADEILEEISQEEEAEAALEAAAAGSEVQTRAAEPMASTDESSSSTVDSGVSEPAAEAAELPPDAFQMLETVPADHHYATTAAGPASRALAKAARKEWRSLQRGLPTGCIWAQAFEERVDLYRAVIVGPGPTPFEDGLFVFDVMLPENYPCAAPKVFYWSHNVRLNPNLYENGKVCLSLLGTWSGDTTEQWNAETSTLLQVLVSIQGLILVEQPYFNEPGYEGRRAEGESLRAAKLYNESARVLTLENLSQSIRYPANGTTEVMRWHIKQRGAEVLQQIRDSLERTGDNAVSQGMQSSLRRVLTRLTLDMETPAEEG